MPYVLISILAIGLAALAARHAVLRRELSRLAGAIERNHSTSAVRQLTIGAPIPQLAELAAGINTLYSDMDEERAANRAAMEEMRQSMANISHDLRTPLTSVIGYLKLLRGGGNSPQQQSHYLDVACQKTEQLHTLVGGLFELARLESGGYTFRHERLDAAALLAEELADLYPQMEKTGISAEVQLAQGAMWVVGDGDALRRVFANLLQNMVKHGQAPMRVQGATEGNMAVFRFANRAPGLSPQDVPRLFQRFFTGDQMRSGRDTGLGLAIVQAFARQMNGEVGAVLKDEMLTLWLKFPLTV